MEAHMSDTRKLLVNDGEASQLLSILPNDLEWLVGTQQLCPIHIRGQRLFEFSQLEALVQTYRTIQGRGNHETPERQ
jgi:hypothetical protein